MMASSIVGADRLNYCNSLLYMTPECNISRLHVQNRLLVRYSKSRDLRVLYIWNVSCTGFP